MVILLVLVTSLHLSSGQSQKEVNLKNLTRQYDLALQVGGSRWQEGNFPEALQLLKTALEVAQEIKDPEKQVKCIMLLGKLYWDLDQPEDSKKQYSEALSGARKANLIREAEVSALALDIWKFYSQGQAELYAGNYEKSIATINSALELARKIGSKEHEVKCLRQLSLVYLAKNDLENFLSINERSLKIAQELNDRREKAKSMINMGSYYSKLSDYSRALNWYSDALDISKDAVDKRNEAFCLKNIGLILSQLGFYERSLDYLLEAYEIEQQSGNTVLSPLNMINLGEAFRNRGLVLSSRKDLYDAFDFFTLALDLGKKNGDKQTELKALNNIGNIHLNLEKYYAAQNYFRQAQQIAEELQDSEARIQILNNL
jgi:tetratricopeptide (TPR) repeat protein